MHKIKASSHEKTQAPPAQDFFIPELCQTESLLAVLIATELLAIMFSLLHVEGLLPWFLRLSQYSLYMQWIALVSSLAICLSRPWLASLKANVAIMIAVAITPIVAGLIAIAVWYAFVGSELHETVIGVPLSRMLGHTLLIAFIMNAVCLRYIYVLQQWRRRIVLANEARVQALQAKVRPHFLFNTMNTISAVLHEDPHKAENAIIDLCNLLRASLNPEAYGTLQDELALCRSYLGLEQLRLGSRLQVRWQIGDIPENAALPRLTLQPLLENSVYHGIETLVDGGTISIKGSYEQDRIHIEIGNDIGAQQHNRSWQGHHQGLAIAKAGMQRAFGSTVDFSFQQTTEHYLVSIGFPYVKATNMANLDSGKDWNDAYTGS